MRNILVFTKCQKKKEAENDLAIIAKAREIAESFQLKVILCQYESECYDLRLMAEKISKIIRKYSPELILFQSTNYMNDLASRVGIRLEIAVITDCLNLYVEKNRVKIVSLDDAGKYSITFEAKRLPVIVTLRQGIFESSVYQPVSSDIIMDHIPVDGGPSRLIIENRLPYVRDDLVIEEAEIILSCGRGIRGEKGMEYIRKLADLLHADIGTSRPNVDDGLLDKEYQIGLSGKTVKPRCYIALGISGAMHHVVGMNQSDWIMAVNVNRNEPIFDVADVGIVGDLTVILPNLINKLEMKYDKKDQ